MCDKIGNIPNNVGITKAMQETAFKEPTMLESMEEKLKHTIVVIKETQECIDILKNLERGYPVTQAEIRKLIRNGVY